MNWHSVQEFIAMGGYAVYVWGSFLMVAAVIAAELAQLAHRARALDARDDEDAHP